MQTHNKKSYLFYIFFVSIFLNTKVAEAKTYLIDSDESIQLLEGKITHNDEIYFLPGMYSLKKPIRLNYSNLLVSSKTRDGNSEFDCPILRKNGNFPAIIINGSNNKINCLRIDGNGNGSAGIAIYGSNSLLNKIVSENNSGPGVLLHGNGPIGDSDCKHNTIKQAVLRNNKVGLSQYNCQGDHVEKSIFINNRLEGITIDVGSHDTTVIYSEIKDNRGGVAGIGIDYSNNIKLSHNIITGNKKGGIRTQNNVGPSRNLSISCSEFNNPGYDIWLRNNNCEDDSKDKCIKWKNITPLEVTRDAPNTSFRYNKINGHGIFVDVPKNIIVREDAGTSNANQYCGGN